jgi:hypothetical protein
MHFRSSRRKFLQVGLALPAAGLSPCKEAEFMVWVFNARKCLTGHCQPRLPPTGMTPQFSFSIIRATQSIGQSASPVESMDNPIAWRSSHPSRPVTALLSFTPQYIPGGHKMRFDMRRYLLAFLLLAISIAPAYSQNATGAINGTVTDPSSALVINAKVTATNLETGLSRNVVTGNMGAFRIDNLPPGDYQVKVEAQGFASQTQKLVVRVAGATTSNFNLSIGQSSEVVEVTGAAALVSTTESTISTVFNRVQVDTLPLNGRSFLSIGMLDPGSVVQYNAGESTMLPVFNATTRLAIASPFTGEVANVQANIQVDGIRVNDRYTGNNSQNFSAEVVQEFQLNTLTFDLSSGSSASGVVNTVTRSGANDFHGGAFYFFRDHNMAAYPALKRSTLNPDPYFARKQYGFTSSGPIRKDKLMFFANYERNDQVGARTIQFTDPLVYSFNHIAKLPSYANVGGIRLDYRLNSKHNAFLRFNVDQNHGMVGGATMESTWEATDNFSYQTVLGLTSVIKPTLVNDIRYGFSYYRGWMAPPTLDECSSMSGNPAYCVGLGGPRIIFNVGGFQIGNDFSLPQDRHQRTNQFTDNISWTKGSHSIRFGGNWEHMWSHGNVNVYRLGSFNTYSPTQLQQQNQALYNALPASLRSVAGTTATIPDMMKLPVSGALTLGIGDSSWPNSYNQSDLLPNDLIRFYAQDGWRVRPKFTVNYGIAWSMETQIPYHKLDWPAYMAPLGLDTRKIPTEYDHWEPALGIAWSPGKSNKTVIRSSFALHFASINRTVDRNSDQNFRSPAGSGIQALTSASIANPKSGQAGQPTTLSFAAPAAFTGQEMLDYMPTASGQMAQIVAKYTGKDLSVRNIEVLKQTAAGSTSWIFDANYETPYSMQFNAGISRELIRNLGISVDYVMIRSIHFGANDALSLDVNRWNRFSGYDISATTGAAYNLVRNPVLPACTTTQSQDPKALCSNGAISYAFAMQSGRYSSLQIRLDRRFAKGLQFTGTYARSKTSAYNGIARFDNFKDTYGITANAKHKFTANATWTVPEYKGDRKFLRGLFNTWQLSTIMQMQTGVPINVTLGTYDPAGDGISSFRLPGMKVTTFGWSLDASDIRTLVSQYNSKYPSAANVALKDVPKANRDAQGRAFPFVVLPDSFAKNDSFMTHDLRLSRTFKIREQVRLQINAEAFNIFNIANLTGVSGTLDAYVRPATTGGTPTLPATGLLFGQTTARVSAIFGTGGPRAFQLAARLSF